MLHRDFLMRQIHQAVQVMMEALARVMKLHDEERYETALGEIDTAFAGLEIAPRPVGELSADEIAQMCRTSRGFEADLALSIADLLTEEGEIRMLQGDDDAARSALEKALSLYRAALAEEDAVLPLDIGRRMDRLEALLAEVG